MKILVIITALMILLMGCAQEVPEPGQVTTVPSAEVTTPVVETAPTQPEPTSVAPDLVVLGTKNYVMTVDKVGFHPGVLTVPQDYRIKITLTNEDSEEHSFDLIEYAIAENIPAKMTTVIDFVSDTKGEFTFDDRFGQSGTLIVGGKT